MGVKRMGKCRLGLLVHMQTHNFPKNHFPRSIEHVDGENLQKYPLKKVSFFSKIYDFMIFHDFPTNFYEFSWFYMFFSKCEYLWPLLSTSEYFWVLMGTSGSLWVLLVDSRSIWSKNMRNLYFLFASRQAGLENSNEKKKQKHEK